MRLKDGLPLIEPIILRCVNKIFSKMQNSDAHCLLLTSVIMVFWSRRRSFQSFEVEVDPKMICNFQIFIGH